MRAQRGQAAVESIGVALAIAALAAGGTLGAAHRLRGDDGVAEALAAAATGPAPSSPLATAGGGMTALPPGAGGGPVAIAEQLLALGVREEPPGSDGGPMVLAITDGHAEAWCADFISYAYWRAGQPFTGGASGGWRIAGALALRGWFAARGRWTLRVAADPQPGDVVYFTWDHVGMVRRVMGDVLETIEGNASHAVRVRAYPAWRSDTRIDGFGRR